MLKYYWRVLSERLWPESMAGKRGKGKAAKPPAACPVPSDFDPAWYLAEYPDVAAAGMDPWEHYCRHGRAEGLPAAAQSGAGLGPPSVAWRGGGDGAAAGGAA